MTCEVAYPHHLQGICVDGEAIYWSFTTTLVKTDPVGSWSDCQPDRQAEAVV